MKKILISLALAFIVSASFAQTQALMLTSKSADSIATNSFAKVSYPNFTLKKSVDSATAIFRGILANLNYTPNHAPIILSNQVVNISRLTIDLNGANTPAIHLINCSGHITLCTLKNSTYNNALVFLENCHDLTIDYNFISNGIRGVSEINSTGYVHVDHNKISEIADPNISTNGGGNYVQIDGCKGSPGITVMYNQCQTLTKSIGVGDGLSVYQSSGTLASPIKIDSNKILRVNCADNGYAAIVLGDSGTASNQEANGNTIVDVASDTYGMIIGGGVNVAMTGNIIYGTTWIHSAAGIGYFNNSQGYYPFIYAASSNVTITGNRVNWLDNQGNPDEAWYDTTTRPIKTGGSYKLTQPIGWLKNSWGAHGGVRDLTITASLLPNPLF